MVKYVTQDGNFSDGNAIMLDLIRSERIRKAYLEEVGMLQPAGGFRLTADALHDYGPSFAVELLRGMRGR